MADLPDVLPAGPMELRRWRPEDVDDVLEAVAASLPELRAWMPWAQQLPSRGAELDVLQRFDAAFDAGTDFCYGMYEPASRSVVGGCGLHLRHGPHTAEIGYWVRTDRHRRGYATAAARALTAAAFTYLPHIQVVHITMDDANAASAGVPRKLGYSLRGTERRERVAPSHSGRGLRWVMDRARWEATHFSCAPESARPRTMHEKREEFAEAVPRRLVMRAEIGAEHPYWTERGALVDDGLLPLPPDLRRRVREWVHDLWDLDHDTPEAEAWDRKALELHREVVDALGPSFEVTYDE